MEKRPTRTHTITLYGMPYSQITKELLELLMAEGQLIPFEILDWRFTNFDGLPLSDNTLPSGEATVVEVIYTRTNR